MSFIPLYRFARAPDPLFPWRTRPPRPWQGGKRFEFRGEAEALIAAKGLRIVEARIDESPLPPAWFWDFTQDCAFLRTKSFKHSPRTLARLTAK